MIEPIEFYMTGEQRRFRYDLGYDDSLDGDLPINKEYWIYPELHNDYQRGYDTGYTKLQAAVKRLKNRGEA